LCDAALAGTSIQVVHAFWALAGMGWIEEQTALHLLGAHDRPVRIAAIAASGRAAVESPKVIEAWLALAQGPGMDAEKRQVVLSLGNVPTARGLEAMLTLMLTSAQWPEMRSAAVSGLGGRELEALKAIAESEDWRTAAAGRSELLQLLARCVMRERRGDRLEGLVELSTRLHATKWQFDAVVKGVLEGRPKDALGKLTWIRVQRKPEGLPEELESAFAWPGKLGVEDVKVRELTAAEQAQFEKGRTLYEATCVQCHLSSGLGQTGQAPPLRSSSWVLGKDARLARILLQGLRGPVELEGDSWDGEMPSVGYSDEEIAALLTYVRREWGHGAEPIVGATIAKVRAATKSRTQPWTLAELEKIND
jgi:mono/diheme cytochrome c family protein